jgi:hypothetical protein
MCSREGHPGKIRSIFYQGMKRDVAMPRRYYGPIQVKPSLHKIRKRLAESQRWKCYWCGGKIKVYKDRNYYPDE